MAGPRKTSSKKPNAAKARDQFLAQVRLQHFVKVISAIHYGSLETLFEGDLQEGRFFTHNGSGDHVAAAWDANGVVAMAFDHEGGEGERGHPERLFAGAPPALGQLVQKLTTWETTGRLGTAARWISPDGEGSSMPSEQFWGYDQSAKDALEGGGQGWRELASISKTHARIAAKLAKPTDGARQSIDAEDGRALLAPPKEHKDVTPDPKNVLLAVEAFAGAGVDWPDAVETAKLIASDDPDMGYALIDATFAGDLEAVRALCAKGAKLDKRARAGQLPAWRASGGDTPLCIAIVEGRAQIVHALLDAGADPNEKGSLFHPLAAAAAAGSRELCDLVIARGAEVEPLKPGLFFSALRGGSAEVVDLTLELGCPTAMSLHWYEKLLAIVEKSGRRDLLERCQGTEKLEEARLKMQQQAREEMAAAPRKMAWHCRMLHITNAVRGIHFETGFTSIHEGTFDDGRFASTRTTKDRGVVRAVIAWGPLGAIAWATGPRLRTRNGLSPLEGHEVVFASAPPEVRAWAERLAGWEHAPERAGEAFWIVPADSLRGSWGQTGITGVSYAGSFNDTPRSEKHSWPEDATQLDPMFAMRLSRITDLSNDGAYTSVTPEDEESFFARQPKGSQTPRLDGVAEAVTRLAQVGIRWDGAAERAKR
ncbi:MAG: ankyrin repeat domain-containing protein [Polyangiaceae bacterium]|nr:ankyrin repeat domain-containing protein [Polyangiaceae bacterium]